MRLPPEPPGQLPYGGTSPLLSSLGVFPTRRPRRRAGGEHYNEERSDRRKGPDGHGQEALSRFAHHHPDELGRRRSVRMAQGMGHRSVAAESGSARSPAVALVDPGETTFSEGFESETQRREQTRCSRVASYRD